MCPTLCQSRPPCFPVPGASARPSGHVTSEDKSARGHADPLSCWAARLDPALASFNPESKWEHGSGAGKGAHRTDAVLVPWEMLFLARRRPCTRTARRRHRPGGRDGKKQPAWRSQAALTAPRGTGWEPRKDRSGRLGTGRPGKRCLFTVGTGDELQPRCEKRTLRTPLRHARGRRQRPSRTPQHGTLLPGTAPGRGFTCSSKVTHGTSRQLTVPATCTAVRPPWILPVTLRFPASVGPRLLSPG